MYIGYVETRSGNNVFVDIIMANDPVVFTGEFYAITADSGEGSCGELLIKLKRGLETSEKEVKK